MALWTLVFPGFGWLFAGVLFFSHDPTSERKDFFVAEELEEEPERPPEALAAPGQAGLEQRLLEAVDIMPAADILLGADPTLKRSAIETLARIRTPEAIAWLLKARTDQNPEVRFHATSGLTTLKRDYEARIRAAEREVYAKPAETKPQIALQHITEEYALSGLVDQDTKHEMLSRTQESLAKLSEQTDEALLQLYSVEKEIDPDGALKRLEELMRRRPKEKARWLKEQALLLFRLGRYREGRDRIGRLKKEGLLGQAEEAASIEDQEWRSALLWWGHG